MSRADLNARAVLVNANVASKARSLSCLLFCCMSGTRNLILLRSCRVGWDHQGCGVFAQEGSHHQEFQRSERRQNQEAHRSGSAVFIQPDEPV